MRVAWYVNMAYFGVLRAKGDGSTGSPRHLCCSHRATLPPLYGHTTTAMHDIEYTHAPPCSHTTDYMPCCAPMFIAILIEYFSLLIG